MEFSKRNDIVVGAIYPLSGEHAPVGRSIRQALELAVHRLHQTYRLPLLGKRRIRLVWRDSKGDPATGEKAAKQLIRQVGVGEGHQSAVP
ncbi:ABC transporter substrate-binding protein [Ammoniphilus sp. YIM 78166]|uniref:ABC transporter substrate-binding protein n=1 Tax=Ammoniphilus sp. YIM 78166 TaxID=1644106 RepID=UPI001070298B